MPHVKLVGNLDLDAAWRRPPALVLSVPEDGLHIKFRECYLSSSRNALLVRYVVTEGRLTQHVQVIVAKTPADYIVKLDRAYPILRTGGVKLLLAALAGWLEAGGLSVSSTNLESYLQRGRFFAAHGEWENSPPGSEGS
jgi:hypothetical protein